MEVLVYLALVVLVAPYALMGIAAYKTYLKYSKKQSKSYLDLTESA